MENPFESLPNYVALTGIELTEGTPDRARGRLEITPEHHQPYGLVHGGVHCTMVETLASTGAAMWAMAQGMAGAVGVANQTDFLRPMSEGVLLGEATPIYRGRSQQLWQVNLTREDNGALVAQGQVRFHNLKTLPPDRRPS
jgi:uncharacterized protein (TIGR00369 family)